MSFIKKKQWSFTLGVRFLGEDITRTGTLLSPTSGEPLGPYLQL